MRYSQTEIKDAIKSATKTAKEKWCLRHGFGPQYPSFKQIRKALKAGQYTLAPASCACEREERETPDFDMYLPNTRDLYLQQFLNVPIIRKYNRLRALYQKKRDRFKSRISSAGQDAYNRIRYLGADPISEMRKLSRFK